jgi:hypothetical protein
VACAGGSRESGAASAQDDDPYVRKTAAVCVAKLYDINPELVEDRGFLDALKARRPAAHRAAGALQECA